MNGNVGKIITTIIAAISVMALGGALNVWRNQGIIQERLRSISERQREFIQIQKDQQQDLDEILRRLPAPVRKRTGSTSPGDEIG